MVKTKKKKFLYYHGDDGYLKLHVQLDKLTNNSLTKLKNRDRFNPINTLI
jgi:hypothetical protein